MPWIKAWHVIFMVTWFAGLFYLPRLFVYHASATDAAGIERFRVMEARLFAIMTIGAILTAVFGAWLLARNPALLETGWLRAKLALVLLLVGYHAWCGRLVQDLRRGQEQAQRALVPLVQRDPLAPAHRHRAARRRAPVLSQLSASRALAPIRSRHHGG